jgi:hypothetical protein
LIHRDRLEPKLFPGTKREIERIVKCTLQTDDAPPLCAPAALRPLDGRADCPCTEASQLFKMQMELLILSL